MAVPRNGRKTRRRRRREEIWLRVADVALRFAQLAATIVLSIVRR
jgi:hypothetical protein